MFLTILMIIGWLALAGVIGYVIIGLWITLLEGLISFLLFFAMQVLHALL